MKLLRLVVSSGGGEGDHEEELSTKSTSIPPAADTILSEGICWPSHNLAAYKRLLYGSMCIAPANFYSNVYSVFEVTEGIKLCGKSYESSLLINWMTANEPLFTVQVERILSPISDPSFRSLVIETFQAASDCLALGDSELLVPGRDFILDVEQTIEATARLGGFIINKDDGSDGDDEIDWLALFNIDAKLWLSLVQDHFKRL